MLLEMYTYMQTVWAFCHTLETLYKSIFHIAVS